MIPSTPLLTLPVIGSTGWIIIGHITASVVSFLAGILVGWYLAEDADIVTKPHLRIAVAVSITIVWSASIVADIMSPNYSTSVLLYAIMGAVAGYLFSDQGLTINLGP